MRWSPQQEDALNDVARWLKSRKTPLFRLFGYAGTGKTTLARHIAEAVDGEVAFAAFTGKAASVLRAKGCEGATTLHSLIYRSRGSDEEGPSFVINRQSAAAKADLIIIDECSMVDEELGRDLMSFGAPVLVLGDPAQLPPVKGGGFFTEHTPDAMLTEVHRQAQDDPIIKLSMIAREGGTIPFGDFGITRILDKRDVAADTLRDLVMGADQVLVGLNRTRRLYNQRIRALKGFRDAMPAAGEKLVCLRNDKAKGLLNGGVWNIAAVTGEAKGFVKMQVRPDDEPHASAVKVAVLREFFEGREEELAFAIRRHSDEFDYGYALTVHKAQGSQWDNLVLFDESFAFREHRARWLYTGVTRAAKRLTLVV
jgi:ATP-dependent exoDNAse (exonuclease V) alpha subunit